jgi:phage replication O-like protein O
MHDILADHSQFVNEKIKQNGKESHSLSVRCVIQQNELLEQIAKTNLSAYETRVLSAVIRKTWGWYKKWDEISISQFQDLTLLDRRNISRTLKNLITRNIILCKMIDARRLYAIQRDYAKWAVSLRTRNVVSTDTTISTSLYSNNKRKKDIAACVSIDTPHQSAKALEVKEFLDWYHQEYKNRIGKPYMPMGKEPASVREMFKTFSMEELKGLAEKFLDDGNDSFVKKAGSGIAVFKNCLNRLASTKEKKPIGLGDFSKWGTDGPVQGL